MEVVYFYEDKEKLLVDKLLDEEFFKRLGPGVRDAAMMGAGRKAGFYLYVKADNPVKMTEALKLIEESKIPLAKLAGDEEKKVIEAIHREDEDAASGMGAIFG